MTWVYVEHKDDPICTVGYYKPDNEWIPIQDCDTEDEARELVHYLNGGSK